jgi:hypothetical protein
LILQVLSFSGSFWKNREREKMFCTEDELAPGADKRYQGADGVADTAEGPGLLSQMCRGFAEKEQEAGTAG